jgi:hypothetical protein
MVTSLTPGGRRNKRLAVEAVTTFRAVLCKIAKFARVAAVEDFGMMFILRLR